jgi:hypothetical protein
MTVDLYQMSYLAFIFGTKESLYPEIDRVYKQDRVYYYELSKKSPLAKWSCFHSLSARQEDYTRKCIGILEHCYTSGDGQKTLILDWIKKGYRNVWNYAKTNKVLSLTELFHRHLGKRQMYTLLEIQQISFALVYLQDEADLGTEWDSADPQNFYMREAFESFRTPATRDLQIQHYNEKIDLEKLAEIKEHFYIEKHTPHLYLLLDNIMKQEADAMNMGEVIDDLTATKFRRRKLISRGLSKYKNLFEEFFMINGIHKFLGETVTISEKELNFILIYCQKKIKELQLSEEGKDLFVIACFFFTILIKEYGTTKAFYLDKSQEELHLSLQKQKEEIGKREKQLERKEINLTRENQNLKEKNASLRAQLSEMEHEIKKLQQSLNQKEDNSKELASLREMLFKLDKQDEPFMEDISFQEMIESLTSHKLVFLGGHVNLHQKLKELLPDVRFLEIDKVGIDLSFVDNYDAVIVDVNYLSHSFYYKLMSQMNKNKTRLCYLTRKQNVQLVIREMYEFMKQA